MSVFSFKKYKVSLKSDSKKTQGLRTGDIVRRQYFDGKNVIYSLMCVLDYGIDKNIVDDEVKEQAYFIGALLEGDPPQSNEILDFMRVTSLFDVDRLGALYLTASDDQAPYMDVIDGIGRNSSLCWPESIGDTEYTDSQTQYIIKGSDYVSSEYIKSETDNYRICHIIKNQTSYSGFIGLQQDFYQYVANPNRVLVSYKIRSNRDLNNIKCSLEYVDGSRVDGEVTVSSGTDWQYKLHTITVDWSGRHLRAMKLNLNDSLVAGDEVWVSDLNVILLSSVSSYKDASQIRIGKMDGVNDPVFGKLEGYGGYMQKLYASQSAHISGTLTAGDENGFGSTFYAGKIHKNAFINSLNVNFTTEVQVNNDIINPTGVGNVYSFSREVTSIAQTNEWLINKVGAKYCLSFWMFVENPCSLSILQNGQLIGNLSFGENQTHKWMRQKVVFDILPPLSTDELLFLSLVPSFKGNQDSLPDGSNIAHFTSPQLEQGSYATQYQPTDDILEYDEDYGAWFSRGGIGGTIQNPLLQLNYDNQGSIGTRTKSFLLRLDGSGYLANKNINWDAEGKVNFGEDVTLNWDNLGQDTKDELAVKSVHITGGNQFNIIKNSITGNVSYSPSTIRLNVSSIGFPLNNGEITWYFLNRDGVYVSIPNEKSQTLVVNPNSKYWLDNDVCQLKCVVTFNRIEYSDTILIQKKFVEGYDVVISSTEGVFYKNGVCQTLLKADVYYNGILISDSEATDKFNFAWKRYSLDGEEITDWSTETDRYNPAISLNTRFNNQQKFTCEITLKTSSFILGYSVLGKDLLGE